MLKLPLPDINPREWFTSDLQRVDWPRTGLLVLLILALYAALWQWIMPEVRTITTTEFRRVPEIRKVRDVQRVYIPCPEQGVIALDKAEVAKRLDMPWLQGGDIAAAKKAEEVTSPSAEGTPPVPGNPADLQVTATAEIPESAAGYQMVTLFDTKTGETTPVVKEKPLPWFQLRSDLGAGLRYGVTLGDGPPRYSGTAYGFWEFLRIKQLHLIGYGELNTDAEGKLQFDLQYRR